VSNHNLSYFIRKYENAFKDSLIASLNNTIYKMEDFHEAQTIGEKGEGILNKEVRTVSQVFFTEQNIGTSIARRILYNEMVMNIKPIFDNYCSLFPYAGASMINPTFTFAFLKYQSQDKGHYDWHTDDNAQHAPRTLTCILGLNDDYRGGKLKVIDDDNSFHIRKNQLILFPSNFLYPHKVEPVIEGERRVLVIWIK